jgi:hypothetical protein
MPNYRVFQVNPKTEYRLSDALRAMTLENEKTLWLSPKPETKTNPKLKAGDVVYLWESTSQNPAHLVARGKVKQAPTTPMDMPAWQQTFCMDEATGQSGPQFHSKSPRAEIEIDPLVTPAREVDREVTDANPTLRKNPFLKKGGFYQGTIFELDQHQARELDKLAGW